MNTSSLLMIVVLVIASSVSACDSNEPAEEFQVTIRTDKVLYEGAPQITGSYTIENTGAKPVYYVCGGCDGIEEWIGDELNDRVWGWGCLECGRMDPIAPGEHIRREFAFGDGDSRTWPIPEFRSGVLYRVSVQLYKTENELEPLDKQKRVSNWFEMLP